MAATVDVSNAFSIRGPSRGLRLAVLAIPLAGGCYTAQLDPDTGGVFVCDADDEAACPESLVCVNSRCEDPELVPTLEVLTPEDEGFVERIEAVDLVPGMGPMPPLLTFTARVRGTITLVSASAGADPTFGEGHVEISVDGGEPITIDSESIEASTEVMLEVRGVAGPHRILMQAFRNDGEPYDNPEATATRLFWLVRDAMMIERPFIAIKSPFPGTLFDVDDQEIPVEVATLGFELVAPGGPPQADRGHAHLYYDDRVRYPECVLDEDCRESYLDVADDVPPDELSLPSSTEPSAVITAVLANGGHTVYGFPFPCDPTVPGPLELCAPVFDAVEVVRVDDDD